MNNDLLTTLIELAPRTEVATKSSPLPPESLSTTGTPVASPSNGHLDTGGRPPIPPPPFRPLSSFDSIPTTSTTPASLEATRQTAVVPTAEVVPPFAGPTGRVYKRETANHRFIAILHLQGVPRGEIATRLGVSENIVNNVLASQNAKQFMAAKLEAVFKDQTLERLTGLAEQAVDELQKILANPDVRPADKLKAIAMVLDRRFGQTTQVVRHVQGDLSKMSDADLLAVIGETSTTTDVPAGDAINV